MILKTSAPSGRVEPALLFRLRSLQIHRGQLIDLFSATLGDTGDASSSMTVRCCKAANSSSSKIIASLCMARDEDEAASPDSMSTGRAWMNLSVNKEVSKWRWERPFAPEPAHMNIRPRSPFQKGDPLCMVWGLSLY